MDHTGFSDNSILIFFVFFIINCITIYQIILGATKSAELAKHARLQSELLAEIAKKNGVTEEEIADMILKTKKPTEV